MGFHKINCTVILNSGGGGGGGLLGHAGLSVAAAGRCHIAAAGMPLDHLVFSIQSCMHQSLSMCSMYRGTLCRRDSVLSSQLQAQNF
ncbi:hypothetical protein GDO78_018736 [Eleutherodactylus coqui]|uniref:Uncharacterized protein n=1 Tax=Eleutherodactylus coqui TaxID=57060 RepID=A0A8J6EJ01_ELECQ|nr:hypothetical protein GDO78_018736 [Eleutherodactylus coqui]